MTKSLLRALRRRWLGMRFALAFWGRSLSLLLVSLVLSLLLWAGMGLVPALLCFNAAVLLLLGFHLYNLQALGRWLRHPQADTVPDGGGAWASIFARLYRLVRTQHKSQQMLTSALDRFISAGEAMPDGVVVLNADDRIEWCNPSAMRHFGLDRRQDMGQQLAYIVRQPEFVTYLKQEQLSMPFVLRQGLHGERVLSIQMVPFDSTKKLLLSRDISQIDRVQAVHRDFVANVSHELRTPLTVVGGFLETMLDYPGMDAATRERQLDMMHEQTRRMQRLVDDLLTLSRLENGQELQEEAVDVPGLLQLLAAEAEGLSQGRHQIRLQIGSTRKLKGNFDELHSAFGNFVSNAVRYTAQGGVIAISWREVSGEGVFAVQDTGYGIPPEHLPRLTERFYRVDRGRSRESGGTGLGLAIVKHISQRHDARLDIQSEVAVGSTFVLRFPAYRLL